MRYRHFGLTGKAVSAVSLLLEETAELSSPEDWRDLIFAAMENGVNCFDLPAGAEPIERAMADALRVVERRLLFVISRVNGDVRQPMDAARLAERVRDSLGRTGAGVFDVLMLDEAAVATLTGDGRELLAELRAGGVVVQVGASGEAGAERMIGVEPFGVLATPFNLTSGWSERRRLRDASDANMVTVSYDPAPAEMLRRPTSAPAPGRRNPLAGAGTYAFLHETRGWSAEELCVAYALTEPSLATVQCRATRAEHVAVLAAVAERDPPTGLGAQIEMARFAKGGADGHRRRA